MVNEACVVGWVKKIMSRKRVQTNVLGVVLSVFILSATSSSAQGADDDYFEMPKSILSDTARDGRTVLGAMLNRAKSLKCYSYESILSTKIKGKNVVETGTLYFKAPNLVRFEAKKAGKRSGAIVVRQADGKIRGKMGGALGGIKVTLSPQSKMLRTANGFSVLESDLCSMLSQAVDTAADKKCLTGTAGNSSFQVIELIGESGELMFRLLPDSVMRVPRKWSLFNDNGLFSTVTFSNLKILPDLPDVMFTLGKDSDLATDRGSPMSPEEYKLQCDGVRHDLFVDSLKSLARTNSLDEFRTKIVASTVENLVDDVKKLKELTIFSEEGQDVWAPKGKEKLVLKCTQMELLLSAIDPLYRKTRVSQVSKNWHDCVLECRSSLAALLDEIEEDTPNREEFSKLVCQLENQIGKLQPLAVQQ